MKKILFILVLLLGGSTCFFASKYYKQKAELGEVETTMHELNKVRNSLKEKSETIDALRGELNYLDNIIYSAKKLCRQGKYRQALDKLNEHADLEMVDSLADADIQ